MVTRRQASASPKVIVDIMQGCQEATSQLSESEEEEEPNPSSHDDIYIMPGL